MANENKMGYLPIKKLILQYEGDSDNIKIKRN